MTKKTESIILENQDGQRLRIYRVENTEGKDLTFCIGLEGEGQDHFTFYPEDAVDITSAIDTVVDIPSPNRENDMNNNDKAKTPDVLEGVMATTPTITFPPLKDSDGNPEPVLSVRFAVGRFTIEITTDGAGAYLDMEIDGHAEMNASELTALASWAESACKAMDEHNGEGDAKR